MTHVTPLPTSFRTSASGHRPSDAKLPAAIAIPLIVALSVLGWIAVWQFVEWAAWLLR